MYLVKGNRVIEVNSNNVCILEMNGITIDVTTGCLVFKSKVQCDKHLYNIKRAKYFNAIKKIMKHQLKISYNSVKQKGLVFNYKQMQKKHFITGTIDYRDGIFTKRNIGKMTFITRGQRDIDKIEKQVGSIRVLIEQEEYYQKNIE